MRRALDLLLLFCGFVVYSPSLTSAQDTETVLPTPPEAEQQAATKLIRQAFQREYAAATNAAERLDLARKFLEEAERNTADPVHQFVLYREAREAAVSAGDTYHAMLSINALARRFAIDTIAMKAAALEAIGRTVREAAQIESLALNALIILDEAVERDRYDDAATLIRIAGDAARRTRDRDLQVRVSERRTEVVELSREYANVVAAREVLAARADDPEANSIVGAYLCYLKGQWREGLAYLARGKDGIPQTLAARDLTDPAGIDDRILLADGWWDLAKQRDGIARRTLYARAARWYRLAAGQATGVLRTKCESRLVEISAAFVFDGRGHIVTNLERFAPATLEAWVLPDANQTSIPWGPEQKPRSIGWVFGSDIGGQYGIGFGLMDRKLSAEILSTFFESIAEPPPAEWTHVAVVYGLRETRIYSDGRRVASGQATGRQGGTHFVLGCFGENNTSGFFRGKVRSARISTTERYDRDFSPPQILDADSEANLVLDAAVVDDDVALDLSVDGHQGRLLNVDVRAIGPIVTQEDSEGGKRRPPRVAIKRGAALATKTLRVGATFIADRNYEIAAFPREMRDGVFILRDSGSVKSWLPAGQVQVDRDCTAYVALIAHANGKDIIGNALLEQLRLEGWEIMSDGFASTVPGTERWVWGIIRKPVPKGVVDLNVKSNVPQTTMIFVFR